MARFYLTTAIDYANGDPHLGHALEKIGADAIARYHRMAGHDVHFLMGMDEHGMKVAQAAAERGVAPQQQADDIAERFRALWSRLSVSYDQFIRTTDRAHKDGVRALIERCLTRSPQDFYEKSYEGWYCVGCELFKRDDEIEDGRCVLHPTRELQWTEERNWFFRLTNYQEFLEALFREQPRFLEPESRRNEMLRLLESGLEDISITRARLAWAIPFPRPTSDGVEQGTWVWFDALPNYLTATGFPAAGYEARWPAQLHVIGKDITRLHTVIWPAMLQSAGLPLPERVWAHGFAYFRGERFSKSAGVRLDLEEALGRFGPDAFRYFLLREVPFDADGNFSWERFEERYTAELANALGNLASRATAMVEKYFGGTVPQGARGEVDAADLRDLDAYHAAMDGTRGYPLHLALDAVWRSVARANEFIQNSAPWTVAKDPSRRGELETILATACRQLTRQAVCLAPFMPTKSDELWARIGASGSVHDQRFAALPSLDPSGWTVQAGSPLFPRENPAPAA
ncbi:MAG TPA: methionine--tRNA ligase [Gemmatimonadaceae bacterium]|nr:methionine--tRNA ligase [Gemmatimonadaceae bacterium]